MGYYPLMIVEKIRQSRSMLMSHLGGGQILPWIAVEFAGLKEEDLVPNSTSVLKMCDDCPANPVCFRKGIPKIVSRDFIPDRLEIEVPGSFVWDGRSTNSAINCVPGKIEPKAMEYAHIDSTSEVEKYRDLLFKAFNTTITKEERDKLDFQVILDVCSKPLDTEAVDRGPLSAREFENWAKRKYPHDSIVPTLEVMKKLGVAIPTKDIEDFFKEKNQELQLGLNSKELSVCARTLRQALDMIAKPHLWPEFSTSEVENK